MNIEDLEVGVDIESIERWRRALPSLAAGPQRALFSESEHAYCARFSDPAPHYAARWCAKEAVFKAVSRFISIDIRDIHIESDPSGAPRAVLPANSTGEDDVSIKVSISHSLDSAVGFAIATISKRST